MILFIHNSIKIIISGFVFIQNDIPRTNVATVKSIYYESNIAVI